MQLEIWEFSITYLDTVLNALIPSAVTLAVWLKVFFLGVLSGYLSLSALDFLEGEKTPDALKPQKAKIKFALHGGICAWLAQLLEGSDKVIIIQALTVGAAWPSFVNRFRKQKEISDFLNSGDDVPVKKIKK